MMAFTRGSKGTSSAYDRFYAYDEKPRTFVLQDFSDGVSTKAVGDHALVSVMNMTSVGGTLFSLSMPKAETALLADGDIHDHCYADGIWLFRKEKTLYARVEGVISLVGTEDMLTQTNGAIFEIGGMFYVIDGEDVWSVDRDLQAAHIEQRVPVCFTDWMNDGITKTENGKPNPFCRYIDMIISEDTSNHQFLPSDIAYDPEYIKVYKPDSEEEVPVGYWYIVDDLYIDFTGVSAKGCRVRLRLLDSDDESKLSFSSTVHLRTFLAEKRPLLPYMDAKGISYFLTWEGYDVILIARTDDMFDCFSENMITRIPTGESITAIIAYADGYLLFTENAVKKLYFGKNELEEMIVQTETFKHDFGSDMAGSVCGFDDKILFANSKGGIFYINKFGIAERDASRKISENIEDGALGFFSHTEEEYKTARGICAFGRYYLTVGKITYIWDYGAKLPLGTQSREDEKSMVWMLSDGFADMDFLHELTGRLYLWDAEASVLRYYTDTHEDDGMASSFVTAERDMGTLEKKVMTEVGIRYRSSCPLTVKLIFDGEESAAEYRLPKNKNFSTVYIRSYAKCFEKAAVKIFSEGGFATDAVIFRYI